MWLGARGRALVEAGGAEMICAVCAVLMGLYGVNDKMEKLTDRDQ